MLSVKLEALVAASLVPTPVHFARAVCKVWLQNHIIVQWEDLNEVSDRAHRRAHVARLARSCIVAPFEFLYRAHSSFRYLLSDTAIECDAPVNQYVDVLTQIFKALVTNSKLRYPGEPSALIN